MISKHPFISDMTLRQATTVGAQVLNTAGIEDALSDAKLLLSHVIGGDRLKLTVDAGRILKASELTDYLKLIDQRKERKPVSRIIGRKEFWSLEFEVSEAVLDPRPDSETLISAALAQMPIKNGSYMVADFGTGSGCLLLTILMERPGTWGLGLDYSYASVLQARTNARNLEVYDRAQFVVGDWGETLSGSFDLILTNPPYIASAEVKHLAPEVRDYAPKLSLDGGKDGLSAYRVVAPQLHRLLKANGSAMLECGFRQASQVSSILKAAGLRVFQTHCDLAGIDRCLSVTKA